MSQLDKAPRTLTEADVKAIVEEFLSQWYAFVGKSFMKLVWTGVFVILLGIAVFAMNRGGGH